MGTEAAVSLRALAFSFPFRHRNVILRPKLLHKSSRIRICCAPAQSQSVVPTDAAAVKSEYKPGIFDDLLLAWFRTKMAQEVGWDSHKPGYDGLMEVVNRLMMKGQANKETEHAAVRVLRSLFPPFLVDLFRMLVAPIGGGKLAAMMVARVTALSCQWLMGPCTVNSIELPNGSSSSSGVFVERCKYLEESKCLGICTNTCKLPTQTFFSDHMGVPLFMEPNFRDYSCQFNFGVHPPAPAEEKILSEPCLEICPNATRRRELTKNVQEMQCPKV